MPKISIERLREGLKYDPDTGHIYRVAINLNYCKDNSGPIKTRNHEGYLVIYIDDIKILAHRAAWALHHGAWPEGDVDHVNRQRDDNRIENLRIATNAQNQANSIRPNSTGRKGVKFRRPGVYEAHIKHKQKQYNLGRFKTIDEAAHAYNKAAIQYHGEFAVLNPIGTDKE